MALKQRKREQNPRTKYPQSSKLNQIRKTRMTNKSSTDIGKKRHTDIGRKRHTMRSYKEKPGVKTPSRNSSQPMTEDSSQPMTEESNHLKLPVTPKVPQNFDSPSLSRLESLPTELLIKIICFLRHDQLSALFHVSQRIREAVIVARQLYFNFITPDRPGQQMLLQKTSVPCKHWSLLRDVVQTPKAPKHAPRPLGLHLMEMKQMSGVLFQDTNCHNSKLLSSMQNQISKPVSSTRVLFSENKLCQAVLDKLG